MATRCLIVLLPLYWILITKAAEALPQSASHDSASHGSTPGITFYMYPTPEASEEPITEDINALIPSHPITLVLHGFKGSSTAKSMRSIREALLLSGIQNTVIVDWGPLADAKNSSALSAYHHVRDHGVALAASKVAEWLRNVMEVKNISPEDVHLIGFSLGAHCVAIIGQMFNSTIGRITALDPPKFGYETISKDKRLDPSDAVFVNVIHTSGGVLSYLEAIGHVDFYPNGDTMPQMGCPLLENPIEIITCSHYFAFAVFVETILNPKAMMGTECSSWTLFISGLCHKNHKAPMGFSTPNTTRGTFYMSTHNKPPFGDEDPENPIPKDLIQLLVYDRSESFEITSADVSTYLEPKSSPDVENVLSSESQQLDGSSESRVMKVKSVSNPTTTTENIPDYLNSSGLTSQAVNFFTLLATGAAALARFFNLDLVIR